MDREFHYSDNIFEDVVNLRKFCEVTVDKIDFLSPPFSRLITGIIENHYHRMIQQQESADSETFIPTEKQKLEQERDRYKQERNQAQDWFCYYQDKCKELEEQNVLQNPIVKEEIKNAIAQIRDFERNL